MQLMNQADISELLAYAQEIEVILPEQMNELEDILLEEMVKPQYYNYRGWTIEGLKTIAKAREMTYDNFTDEELVKLMREGFEGSVNMNDFFMLEQIVIKHFEES